MAAPHVLDDPSTAPTERSDDSGYEIIDGERRELEPTGALQVGLASLLSALLGSHAIRHRLGLVVSEMLFVLDAERPLCRRPDVAFVSYPRWPEDMLPDENAWNVVPDLAIEVVSPTNFAEEIDRKVLEYFTAGVRRVWVIYPETRRIHVYRSAATARILDETGELDGEDVLPGFRLPVPDLFQAVRRPDEFGREGLQTA